MGQGPTVIVRRITGLSRGGVEILSILARQTALQSGFWQIAMQRIVIAPKLVPSRLRVYRNRANALQCSLQSIWYCARRSSRYPADTRHDPCDAHSGQSRSSAGCVVRRRARAPHRHQRQGGAEGHQSHTGVTLIAPAPSRMLWRQEQVESFFRPSRYGLSKGTVSGSSSRAQPLRTGEIAPADRNVRQGCSLLAGARSDATPPKRRYQTPATQRSSGLTADASETSRRVRAGKSSFWIAR
jgi:hypothetical protein